MTTKFRLYYSPEGCDLSYCGEFGTAAEAEDFADGDPRGLPRSMWDTARAAGGCDRLNAPPTDGEEAEDGFAHCGPDANHYVVPTKYQPTPLELVAEVLVSNGERFTGSDAAEVAQEWIDYGFDADDVSDWCDIGCWDAATAAAWRDAGLSPDQVLDAARSLIDAEDEPEDTYTDGCPIYSCCNGDTDSQVVIDWVRSEKVSGRLVQCDRSGVGHAWKNVAADTLPASVREEIEGEIEDGTESCEDFVASNGLHYRW